MSASTILAAVMLGSYISAPVPAVHFNSAHLDAIGKLTGNKVEGRYEPTLNIIYLRNGWNKNNCHDQSVLLHEYMHSLGYGEVEAYEAQHEFEGVCK